MHQVYQQFPDIIQPDSICFDIGANVGQTTQLLLALNALVVALEPCMSKYHLICERFSEQMAKHRLSVIPFAAGFRQGYAQLWEDTLVGTMSTLSQEFRLASQRFGMFPPETPVHWVNVITLDQLIDTYGKPSYCKIDVEGYDAEVLKGLKYPLPLISFEFNCLPELHPLAFQGLAHLNHLGDYRYNVHLYGTPHLLYSRWMSYDEMCYSLQEDLPKREFPTMTHKTVFGDIYAKLQQPKHQH